MQHDRPPTASRPAYPGRGRSRVLIILAVTAACLLAGALHLVGVLPPG